MNQNEKHPINPGSILARVDGSELKCKKHHVVYSQGNPAGFVFYVQDGRVKVSIVSEEGKEAVVAILQPGNFFGEEGLTGHKLRMATVTALTECVLLQMPKASVIRALHIYPDFSELFTTYLMEHNIRALENLIDQRLNSTEKRLARLLLLLTNCGKEDRPDPIIPKISQETLAEMIGTSRTNVNFFMNKFRQSGFVEYDGDAKSEIRVNRYLLNRLLHEGRKIASGD